MGAPEGILDKLASRGVFGIRPGLETIRALLSGLGDPQDALRCVHVAGTNGKGSVVSKTEAVLREAGFKTARYTSPHLVRLNERFFFSGREATDGELAAAAECVAPVAERTERRTGVPVTYFEFLTAMAFRMFAERGVDVAVMETGLGGRLDATNAISGGSLLAAVVTRIGLDHCQWLGGTLSAIAGEKAGIMKRGRPVVLGAQEDEARGTLLSRAAALGCKVWDSGSMFPPQPTFIGENEATVRATIRALNDDCGFAVDAAALERGLAGAVWPGRFQRFDLGGVPLYADGAHNPDGARALRSALENAAVARPVGMIAGFCGDKDVAGHLGIMSGIVDASWSVPVKNARSMDFAETARLMREAGIGCAAGCATLEEALAKAEDWGRRTGGTLVLCGSLFLVGEFLAGLPGFLRS